MVNVLDETNMTDIATVAMLKEQKWHIRSTTHLSVSYSALVTTPLILSQSKVNKCKQLLRNITVYFYSLSCWWHVS